MDYAQQQRNPSRHLFGIGTVVLLHIIVVYALVSGLARKVVDVVKGPIEVKVIEEAVKKPPPPPDNLPPPPKLAAPPPPFIPPPEVNVASPPAPAAITAVTQVAPPGPTAPAIAKVETPSAPTAAANCPNHAEAIQGIKVPRNDAGEVIVGEVVVEFTIAADGKVRDPTIRSSTNRNLNRVALSAVYRLTCRRLAQDTRVTLPIGFRSND